VRTGEAIHVRWDGKQLAGGRQCGSMKPLQVEVRDVLFVIGQPRIRKAFRREDKGKIRASSIAARVGIRFGR